MSYIKPQLSDGQGDALDRCISLMSYIKPQLKRIMTIRKNVVYRLCPTSNHNYEKELIPPVKLYIAYVLHQTTTFSASCFFCACCISLMSYIKPQLCVLFHQKGIVVYRLCPTSNHNQSVVGLVAAQLYIAYVLHQTTTLCLIYISFPVRYWRITSQEVAIDVSFLVQIY